MNCLNPKTLYTESVLQKEIEGKIRRHENFLYVFSSYFPRGKRKKERESSKKSVESKKQFFISDFIHSFIQKLLYKRKCYSWSSHALVENGVINSKSSMCFETWETASFKASSALQTLGKLHMGAVKMTLNGSKNPSVEERNVFTAFPVTGSE